MYKGRSWAFLAYAIFMGYIGILIPPSGDLYRYQMDFYMYEGLSWEQFFFSASLKFDYLLSIISYSLGRIGWNFDLTRFLYNFITYLLLGRIYVSILDENKALLHNNKCRLYALIIFFALNLTSYCLRFGFSCILFSYGAYLVINKKMDSGYIYLILSVINHFSFLLLFVAFLFKDLHFLRFNRKVVVVLCLATFGVSSDFVVTLFQKLPFANIVEHYSYYLDGYWASDFVEDRTLKARILILVTNLIYYLLICVYLYKYNKNSRWSPFINLIIILILISSPFGTIKARYLFFLSHIIKIYILLIFTYNRSFFKLMKLVALTVLVTSLMDLWATRRQIDISDMGLLFTSSSYGIMTHTYDYGWLHSNINNDGGINTSY